jgi:putative (di)nucleoside polyphosphate hydrolase
LLWARRIRQDAWQFPQGGIRARETPEQAMYRELGEEIGLEPDHVDVLGATRGWLRYRLPERFIRRQQKPVCIGQKQIWFMLRLVGEERYVRLDLSDKPEFDNWRWVDYWHPLREVVPFKRTVYRKALKELAPLVFPDDRTQRSLVR